MVKHNNVIPNAHFKKHWQERVRVTLDQPARKKRRRLARKAKAAAIAPRPAAGLFRPVVRCPTQKYNMKLRQGRGFTLEELKAAGINRKDALNIGIAVDARRKNKSVESLQQNVDRLKAYKQRLIVFPRGSNKKGGSGDTSMAQQLVGEIMPVSTGSGAVEFADIPKSDSSVYQVQRKARSDARMIGIRARRAIEKAEEEAANAGKKKKKKKGKK